MAKKKYYAVRIGNKPGIYETWAECELQIKGVSGAIYKSFATMAEAEKFIADNTADIPKEIAVDDINSQVEQKLLKLKEDEIIAFVDGSYNSKEEKAGFGAILIDNKGVQTSLYKSYTKNLNPEFIELRNVAAELEGVKEAIKCAVACNKGKITIYYDYEGIGRWADGSWQAKKNLTRQYVTFLKEKQALISIEFIKVPAHSGIEYNEAADALAKKSLLEKGYKTYDDGSIYVVGFSADDWKTIVELLNGENEQLAEGKKAAITLDKVTDNRQRLVISNEKNRIIINCYSGCRSFVQGKQSTLFQKIISLAIEKMKDGQTVIETLNHMHVLTISQDEVETKFEELLPNYNGKRSEKHYNNLLSAVYNTMLTGYMPDYTSLITPIFRAYEYYLHRILGDKMGLNTCDRNGKNNFGYFNKNVSGRYEVASDNTATLNTSQVDFLNDLYNAYHGIRHPYSHWSVDDYDTAVITNIESAREYLIQGLTLVDKYYILF